jgi:rhodanese-related sulfurtransferase
LLTSIEIQFTMEELSRTNWLLIAVVAFVLVIVLGLIGHKKPIVQYALTPTESLSLIEDPAFLVSPEQAAELLKENTGKTVFIDVRNAAAFNYSHVLNALHIPVQEIFSEKSVSVFREMENAGKTAVLYGETPHQANGPWQMLAQTGFKNVKLFTGVYSQLVPGQSNPLIGQLPLFSETPCIDTAALRLISTPVPTAKTPVPPAKKEKKIIAPVKRENSSSEGC